MALLSGFKRKNGSGSFSMRKSALLAAATLVLVSEAPAQTGQPPLQTDLQVPASGPMRTPDLGQAIPAQQPPNVNMQPRSPYSLNRAPNPVPPPPEIAAALDAFFKGLMRANVAKSFADLLKDSRLAAQQESVNFYVDKIQQALTLYGKMSDYEVYDTRPIGAHLVATTYISSLAISPLKWRFVFYRSGTDKGWTVIKLSISDSIDDLTEQ
ncbi:MAG TPA: hypothetical protein VIM58_00045 [Candidatus Methylacidiphilales bacterium]